MMMTNRTVLGLFSVLACFAGANEANAQSQPDTLLQMGSRIRVQSPAIGAKPRIGNFVSVARDTLSFTLEGETVSTRIPVAQVTALDLSVGTTTNHRAVGKRNQIAEIVGAVAGAAIGNAAGSGSSGMRLLLGAAFGLGGYFAGREYGLYTGSSTSDVWQPVALRPGTR